MYISSSIIHSVISHGLSPPDLFPKQCSINITSFHVIWGVVMKVVFLPVGANPPLT